MWIAVTAGFISGIISGMGIGGGTVLIPILVFVLRTNQHIAQSINLLYFIPTAVIALIVHIKNKNMDFKLAVPIVLFGILGALIGSRLAVSISSANLKKIFGMFLLCMGTYEIFRK